MAQPVFEMMVKVVHLKKHVRVWLQLDKAADCNKTNIKDTQSAIRSILDQIAIADDVTCIADDLPAPTNADWAESIAKRMSDENFVVNAVEVLSKKGNGGLYYPDWP